MSEYDDMGLLGQYLGEFNTRGDVPTSFSGYGFGQARHRRALGGLGAAAAGDERVFDGKPHVLTQVGNNLEWKEKIAGERVAVRDLQSDLRLLQAGNVSGGKMDAATRAAWSKYVTVFKEPYPALKTDGLYFVEIHKEAASRLRVRGRAAATAPAAKPAARTAAKPAARTASPTPKPSGTPAGSILVNVTDLQEVLVKLGHSTKGIDDGEMGPTTRSKWIQSARKRGLNQTITGAAGATSALVSEAAYNALRAAANTAAPSPAPTPAPAPTPGPSPTPAAKNMVLPTSDVQTILKQLGAPPDRLSDGKFGRTTSEYWTQSASKRGLDPSIALKTKGDLKTVVVREATYYKMKADADAKGAGTGVPAPGPGGEPDLRKLPASDTVTVPLNDLIALTRLFAVPMKMSVTNEAEVQAMFDALTAKHGLDQRLQSLPSGSVMMLKTTWVGLNKAVEDLGTTPAPGPAADEKAQAVAQIKRGATSKVKVITIRAAINSAIQNKSMDREPFAEKGSWKNTLREPLMDLMGIARTEGALTPRDVWRAALTKGSLVSKDGNTVQLPPKQASDIQKAARTLKKALAEEDKRLVGYTEVKPPDLISKINSMAVSEKKFDTSGGPAELADAIVTFLQNTKRSVPSGKIVDTDQPKNWTKVYVKTDVLNEVAKAALEAQQRADATKKFRDAMVSKALSSATATITVKDLQQAIADTVLSKGADARLLKTYAPVKVTSQFDKQTRNAFTELARGKTIGPLVLEFETMLKQQLGPKFKVDIVEEARNQVWEQYLLQAVAKRAGAVSIKTLPDIAKAIEIGADHYRKTTSLDKRKDEENLAYKKDLAKAVAKSTAIVSVLDVQLGLMQMTRSDVDQKSKITATGVTPTGRGNKQTADGLYQLTAYIWPTDYQLFTGLWDDYLKNVGIKILDAKNVIKAWDGADYVALPPALANDLADAAGRWIESNGDAGTRASLAPLPRGNESLQLRFKDLTVLGARKPGKPEEKPVFTGDDDAEAKAEVAAKKAKKKKKPVTKAAKTQDQLFTTGGGEAVSAGGEAAGGQAAGGQAAGGQSAGGEAGGGSGGEAGGGSGGEAGGGQAAGGSSETSVTGPTINIQAPQQAGMGGGMLFGLMAAAGVLALLLKGGDDATERGDERFQA